MVEEEHLPVVIVMADDDEDDCMILEESLADSELDHELHCVRDGVELMNYLRGTGRFEKAAPTRPDLIILDLNMPEKDGRAALREIKGDPDLMDIPVMVLTESGDERDAELCYEMGANTYFVKSEWLDVLSDLLKASSEYWFDSVSPGTRRKKSSAPERTA
ncbi:MAG: response regulator [Acidobacteriota bacterium]